MNGWVTFIIVIIVLGLLAGGGWFGWKHYQKTRGLSSPYPTPAPSGIADWVKDKWHAVRNPKSQSGAGYESTGGGRGYMDSGSGGQRGFRARGGNALDPDEAWDARVGNEADVYGPGGYYEEQELGLHPPRGDTSYHGATGGGFEQTNTLAAPNADRDRSRSPARSNPFGDDNAASLRSISPRPAESGAPGKAKGSADESPTYERRSMFREEV